MFYYRYENTHEELFIEARHGRIEAFCGLTGVTSLTGPPDWSDQYELANCSRQIKEERRSVKHLLINICFKKDLMRLCTTDSKKF